MKVVGWPVKLNFAGSYTIAIKNIIMIAIGIQANKVFSSQVQVKIEISETLIS